MYLFGGPLLGTTSKRWLKQDLYKFQVFCYSDLIVTWWCYVESSLIYLFLADALLVVHALIVVFIMVGLLAIYAGKYFVWSWVRNPWFRMLHIAAIGVVVIQSWLGIICPLTTWEMYFRSLSGETVYTGSFIAYWLGRLLYYQLPEWVFLIVYTVFGVLVLASWFYVRPRRFVQH